MNRRRPIVATLLFLGACANAGGPESQSVLQHGTGEPETPAETSDAAVDASKQAKRDAASTDSSPSGPADEDDAAPPSTDAGAGDAQACVLIEPLSPTASACDQCIGTACCTESNACYLEPECGKLGTCEFGCLLGSASNCVANCEKDHAQGKAAFDAQLDCAKQKGNSVCYAACHP